MRDSSDHTPLMAAVQNGHLEVDTTNCRSAERKSTQRAIQAATVQFRLSMGPLHRMHSVDSAQSTVSSEQCTLKQQPNALCSLLCVSYTFYSLYI